MVKSEILKFRESERLRSLPEFYEDVNCLDNTYKCCSRYKTLWPELEAE